MSEDLRVAGPAPTDDEIQFDEIVDGQKDIAKTIDGDMMMVEADGRKPLQRVWLWTESKKRKISSSSTTNKSFKIGVDGPPGSAVPSKLPGPHELESHQTASEYLEVGFIIGDEPDKFKSKGATRDAAREKARREQGIMRRDQNAMRAFTPVTPMISKGVKYYVGVKEAEGRLFPRVIAGDNIFFYAEFWHGLRDGENKRARNVHVSSKTAFHAASNKTSATHNSNDDTSEQLNQLTESTSLRATPAENLAHTLVLQSTLFEDIENRKYFEEMLKLMESKAQDLKAGPHAKNDGVKAFFAFDNASYTDGLGEEEIKQIKDGLKKSVPTMPNLDPAVIQDVRRIIKDNDWSKRLHCRQIGTLLDLCQMHVSPESAEEVKTAQVDEVLAILLRISDGHTF
ncbi:hypothetical protein KC343_g6576 [Hortaea werneckii]|nr:hypothetical protein KC323_g2472 [Hortaea werneckii]KAI6871160.1 hypothetical protein KC338_g2740 [Hortaea werneckii]KAI7189808.1 hypothetical protein KC352_g21846 [Hortaea werneckii]KAI7344384.1 hypothetical protein KC320_g8873 [Hortaea werneckii]KAI7561329.1 hypothetical protein KC317_g9136 [Hortaea werneckii]